MRSAMERGRRRRRLELLLRVCRARGHAPHARARARDYHPHRPPEGGGRETDFPTRDDEPSSNSK